MSFRRRLIYGIVRHRLIVLLTLASLTLVLAYPLRGLRIEQRETGELSPDDPEVAYFDRFQQRFNTAELMVALVCAEDVFDEGVLAVLRSLTGALENLPRVSGVFSLSNAVRMVGEGEDVVTEPFLESLPATPDELRLKREEALSNPRWVENLVSPDGTVAAVNIMLDPLAGDSGDRIEVVDSVRAILKRHGREGVRLFLTGISPLMWDMRTCVGRDVRSFLWLTPLLILVLLFLTFRTIPGVAIPMLVIVTSVVWTLGLFAAAGRRLGMATAMVPTLIAVICLSDVIHILSHYYEILPRHEDRRDALAATMEHMMDACFMTSITTAAGFASMIVSPIRTIREFGLATAIGILIAYVLAMIMVPASLSLLPPRAGRPRASNVGRGGLGRFLAAVNGAAARRHRGIVIGTLLGAAACVVGIARLRVETQISSYLPDSAPSVRALAVLQKNMAGFGSLEIGVDGTAGVFREPWALTELQELQRYLESRAEIDKVFSVTELLRECHRVRSEEGAPQALPRDTGKIAEYYLLLSLSDEPALLEAVVSEDYSSARVTARMRAVTTSEQVRLLADVDAFARDHIDPRLHVHTTGVSKLYATRITALVRSQLHTLLLTSIVIALLLAFHLRSVRSALVAMIPNILPVIGTLGLMGLSGISLNLSTVMISCVALGIAVDDTIHFLVRYRRESQAGAHTNEAIALTVQNTGRAMVFTSLVIAGGFALFVFSSFAPNRHFGILMAFTLGVALLADIVLLPFLIRAFSIGWRKGDV